MSNNSTVTILGAGYVGLTTAALLAHSGYKVYVIEPNQDRLQAIREGRSWFFEEGIDPIIQTGLEKGALIPTDSYSESVPKSSVVFSCVGTPDNPDGSSNLTYVFAAAEEAAKYLDAGSIYVQKSTVPVGTGAKIEELFKKLEKKVHYVSNPEFLREGTAVYDTLYFDRVVAGGDDQNSVNRVLDIYRDLENSRDHIASIGNIQPSARKNLYIATGLNSAELIKVTSNAFLALKISFANSIAKLADKANADIVEVMNAVGADERIGRAFLNAGRGYGGGCFPKDVSGLISSGLDYGVDLEVMQAAQSLNRSMPGYIIEKLQNSLEDNSLNGKTIAVLGLAFKAGTSDVRKSPGIALANQLKLAGATVKTYDPQAKEEAAEDLLEGIDQLGAIEDTIKNADALIIATEWEELLGYPPEKYLKHMAGSTLFDAVNRYPKEAAIDAGLTYVGVGR